jgi:hypothetical protein
MFSINIIYFNMREKEININWMDPIIKENGKMIKRIKILKYFFTNKKKYLK